MEQKLPFDVWLEQSSLASNTQRDYYRAIEGRISDWAHEGGLITGNLLDITGSEGFEILQREIEKLPIFRERNGKENYRFSAALRRFADFLSEAALDTSSADVESIQQRDDIPETDKRALINARIGQGRFRHKLLEQWGRCAVLGTRDRFLLVASHIKPWSKSTDHERLDPYNGLLLTAHIDRCFDQGRISFREDGHLLVSPLFQDAGRLGINERLKITFQDRHSPYLDYHRRMVFKAA